MTKTITKQITFEKVMVEFKKYVAKGETREVLKKVYFDGTHFIATDSHTLLKVNRNYVSNIPSEVVEGSMYDPVKMEIYKNDLHTYPETSRLIPQQFNLRVRINNTLNEIQAHIKLGNSLMKDTKPSERLFKFYAQDDFLKIDALSGLTNHNVMNESIMRHNDYLESNGKEITFTLSNEFITNALIVAKKLSKLSTENVELKVISRLRPVVIAQDDVFTILIMPMRTY